MNRGSRASWFLPSRNPPVCEKSSLGLDALLVQAISGSLDQLLRTFTCPDDAPGFFHEQISELPSCKPLLRCDRVTDRCDRYPELVVSVRSEPKSECVKGLYSNGSKSERVLTQAWVVQRRLNGAENSPDEWSFGQAKVLMFAGDNAHFRARELVFRVSKQIYPPNPPKRSTHGMAREKVEETDAVNRMWVQDMALTNLTRVYPHPPLATLLQWDELCKRGP